MAERPFFRKVLKMQKVIIEDVTDYKKLQEWIDILDPKLLEEYQGAKTELD
mgnify:CR=1 FL=1